MSLASIVLLVAAALVALVDWWAVASGTRRVEYVAKPLTLLLLIGVALTIDPSDATQRDWFVGALVASLVGDVALMLPARDGGTTSSDEPILSAVTSPPMTFTVGVLAFLVGHLGYIGGFLFAGDLSWIAMAAGAGVVTSVGATAGASILRASRRVGDLTVTIALAAYLVVIGAMVVIAYGSGDVLAIVGATSFLVSDALIGWTRFVRPLHRDRVVIMVTYHLAQTGLVLSLLN